MEGAARTAHGPQHLRRRQIVRGRAHAGGAHLRVAHPREYVDVVAVQFRSADGYLRAVSAIPAAHRCTAATVRRTIRKVDPRASVRLTGLSLAVPRTRALADRLVERSQTLQLATVLVVDHVFVFDPARRRFLDVVLRSFGRPPPVALERAALAAALR
jgi:hypothetical protein